MQLRPVRIHGKLPLMFQLRQQVVWPQAPGMDSSPGMDSCCGQDLGSGTGTRAS